MVEGVVFGVKVSLLLLTGLGGVGVSLLGDVGVSLRSLLSM